MRPFPSTFNPLLRVSLKKSLKVTSGQICSLHENHFHYNPVITPAAFYKDWKYYLRSTREVQIFMLTITLSFKCTMTLVLYTQEDLAEYFETQKYLEIQSSNIS